MFTSYLLSLHLQSLPRKMFHVETLFDRRRFRRFTTILPRPIIRVSDPFIEASGSHCVDRRNFHVGTPLLFFPSETNGQFYREVLSPRDIRELDPISTSPFFHQRYQPLSYISSFTPVHWISK